MAVDLKKLIDADLLAYFKSKLDLLFTQKVDKVDGKGLSTNDYTAEEKTKLAGIATGAQVNVLEGVQVNGVTVTPTNKIANIPAATQSAAGVMTADDKKKLAGIAAGAQVNVIETVKRNGTALPVTGGAVDITVPTGGTAAPAMDGTAAAGSAATWAHSDHVHPHDSTKVDKVDGKGLSTNDFDDSYKSTIDTLPLDYVTRADFDDRTNVLNFLMSISISNGVRTLVLDCASDNTAIGSIDRLSTALQAGVNIWFQVPDPDEGVYFRWYITDVVVTPTPRITLACYTPDGTLNIATLLPVSATQMRGLIIQSAPTTNDFTDEFKTKLQGIETGAQVNVVTDASSSGSGAAQTMTVNKGATGYTTYTKSALDTALAAKAAASSVYTKTEIDQKLAGAMNYKGTKATTAALPASGNVQGDVWHVTADGSEWAWNGSAWEELGTAVDLSGYVEESDLGLATTDDIDALFA